jgi:L-asparagine oxygenase
LLPPDYVLLLCLRGDANAATLVSPVAPHLLSEEAHSRLTRPVYMIRADSSYAEHSALRPSAYPVLSGANASLLVRYDPLYTVCEEPEDKAALNELTQLLGTRALGVTLRRGDLLIIDNRRAVHARRAFSPRYEGADRWIQRTVVLARPAPHRLVARGQPLQIRSILRVPDVW